MPEGVISAMGSNVITSFGSDEMFGQALSSDAVTVPSGLLVMEMIVSKPQIPWSIFICVTVCHPFCSLRVLCKIKCFYWAAYEHRLQSVGKICEYAANPHYS